MNAVRAAPMCGSAFGNCQVFGEAAMSNYNVWYRLGRWLKRVAYVMAAFLIVVVMPLAFIMYPVFKPYPDASPETGDSLAEKNAQDLSHLRNMQLIERSFKPQTSLAFGQSLDELTAKASELDRPALAMAAAKAVALAQNGHTNVLGLAGGQGFNSVPLRLGWFADGLFVVRATTEHRDLLGAQVLTANGLTPDELVAALRPYVGGTDQYARELSPNFMISPELLHAARLAAKPDESEFRLRKADGSEIERTLAVLPGKGEPVTRTVWPKRDLSPIAPDKSDAGWVHVLDGVDTPRYLARPGQNSWHAYLEADEILYVQLNRLRDQEPVLISDYLTGLLAEAGKRKVKHAVVDLRFSPGGNYMLATDFSRLLPEVVPDGRIFILTSGNTFSAAISIASRLKYYAGERAVLVGEEMGDAGQMWGEGGTTIMPNSRIAFRYTTAYHDWENGCRLSQLTTCFLPNYFYGTAAGSLQPTVPVAQTFASYAAGEDAVMSEVLRLAKQGE
ncbi:hypothetical protein QEZ47_11045 [Aminobacter anthyllidis]|uniref:hypothetical protein n=1 Tax=Aminobacter anthyllidis TaxID=1035067 RepID=UPI0024580746|nr:hypothetical protein [Aminobacter anthyllidis]MDH4986063.1 hypothetical protein [Aminobacter anthyllidis]